MLGAAAVRLHGQGQAARAREARGRARCLPEAPGARRHRRLRRAAALCAVALVRTAGAGAVRNAHFRPLHPPRAGAIYLSRFPIHMLISLTHSLTHSHTHSLSVLISLFSIFGLCIRRAQMLFSTQP